MGSPKPSATEVLAKWVECASHESKSLAAPAAGAADLTCADDPLAAAKADIPLLGVCLGHQSIGAAFGGKIIRAQQLMHGKTSVISTDERGVYSGLPQKFTVIRYHSLAIELATLPENREKLQPGMSLIEALTIAGGVTRRGSTSRIEIKRKLPDGKFKTVSPKLNDELQADDVIRVKESIF